jgi:hypothetical protein
LHHPQVKKTARDPRRSGLARGRKRYFTMLDALSSTIR